MCFANVQMLDILIKSQFCDTTDVSLNKSLTFSKFQFSVLQNEENEVTVLT